ncbi:GNAT family N-acetyltransferase [Stigmatella aurantiaca]|uniref:Acetyltransferase, GNAT family n=1 Tax=Stigmatella aurantiaca (strain DW4/3-1) TaxID=378806 RepID=Q096A9_STIAD|nr:GNAT family N-acetyltransferase [Stigmatella aurantiaca]ADO74922.1 Acetyltransferase, GNAT family [Stigmatella aurantiaca DW4/3-1]EAU67537.1 histone acetyltransferase HPA2 [Stigmatella aurantiaca DW4/3-1]
MSTEWILRPIARQDDAAVAHIIRTVMPEFGADGPGFALHDPEVDRMSAAYSRPGHAYFVLEQGGRVAGGGGIAPLAGNTDGVCELQKMYFLPEARGQGQGERMLRQCLAFAREAGYRLCYLETLTGMDGAQKLYQRLGFERIPKSMGSTGHFGCDRFYTLRLQPLSGEG